jgi:hypothetical protein
MAKNKRDHSWVCFIHVLVYLIPMSFTGLQWWQLLIIGGTHFLQDRTDFVYGWMRNYKRVPREQWGAIHLLVDQGFHFLAIELALYLGTL